MLLLFLNEAYNAEQLIRWYVAFPFFLIAVTNYIDKKYLLALLLAILSCSIHKGLSILIGIVWAVSYIKKQIVPTWLAAILFALSVFLGRISIFDSISPYLTLISFEDEKTMIYLNRFSDFVTDNVTDREVLTYTILNKVRMYGAYIFAVFMLPLLLKKKIISVFETNVFLISLILFPMLCQADVLNRYGDGLKFISTIVSAAGYGYVITNRKQFPRWLYYMCFISIYFYMKPQFDRIFMRSEWWTMLYVWDANGQDCLPKSLFLK